MKHVLPVWLLSFVTLACVDEGHELQEVELGAMSDAAVPHPVEITIGPDGDAGTRAGFILAPDLIATSRR